MRWKGYLAPAGPPPDLFAIDNVRLDFLCHTDQLLCNEAALYDFADSYLMISNV